MTEWSESVGVFGMQSQGEMKSSKNDDDDEALRKTSLVRFM